MIEAMKSMIEAITQGIDLAGMAGHSGQGQAPKRRAGLAGAVAATTRVLRGATTTRVLRGAATTLVLSLVMPIAVFAQGAPAPDEAVKGNPVRAREKVAMCIGCHGIAEYKASFPEVYRVPMIAGQSERYLQSALAAYRKGDRSHPTMRAIAGSLSDEDILDLAAYYAGGGALAIGSAAK